MWDVANMRPVLGLQLLMAQGLPADLKLHFDPTDVDDMDPFQFDCVSKFVEETGRTRVDDADLKSMAGNTMTVQVMGIIQAEVKRCQEVKHSSQEVAMNKAATLSLWHNVCICIPLHASLHDASAIQQNPT